MGRNRDSTEEYQAGGRKSSVETFADDAFVMESEDDIPNTQQVDDRVLKDVVAYIEVRTKTENRSKGVSKQLELLGAKVEKKFTNDVTHVVWKDGKKSTRDKAVKKGVRLVSVLWVDSCKQNQEHVAESLFPISTPDDKDIIQIGKLKRMKSMQPKDVEEDIQRSAGWGTRKRRARVPHPSPAPLTIVNPAILVAETQPMTPVTGEVPHTPSLIPETPSSMKPCLDLLDSIKKGKGSAKRRVSITNSPNISPSTPLRQRLFQCFTEEANSCTESPSTSVKLHKSGPVRRPASRRNLLEEDIEMESDTPSVELEAKSTVRGRRSTITNDIVKLPEGGEIKVGTASRAEAARSSRRRSHVIEATPSSEETKSGLSHPEVAESRRSRGRKSTPRGTKHLEVQEERLNKLGGEEAEINVNGGDASQSQGGVGEPKVQISSSGPGSGEEIYSKKERKGKRDVSLKRKLSLDGEASTSKNGSLGSKKKRSSGYTTRNESVIVLTDESDLEITDESMISSGICAIDGGTRSALHKKELARLQEDCKSSRKRLLSRKKQKQPRTKDTNEIKKSTEKNGDSDMCNVAIASVSSCGTGTTRASTRRRSCLPAFSVEPSTENGEVDQTRRRSNRRKSVTPLVNSPSIAAHLKPLRIQSTRVSGEIPAFPMEPSTENVEVDLTRRRSNRRKSVTPLMNPPSIADHLKPLRIQSTRVSGERPAFPVEPSTEIGQMDQTRTRSNRRKSVTPLVNSPSIADHLKPMVIQSTKVSGEKSSRQRTRDVSEGTSPCGSATNEEEECGPQTKRKRKASSCGNLRKSLSSGGSQKSTLEELKEEPSKAEEKENLDKENASPMALVQRIGSLSEDDERKRKLLSPLDLTCSSILSSLEVQNRPSLGEFKPEGSTRSKSTRSALKLKSSAEVMCTSSEGSVVSTSDDLDDARRENKTS
nr:bromodomain-containing protein DDB_G0270170-like [Lytechinus pictus]